jgi:hypothetical protein
MNKRIQELMEQAQDWVDQRAPFASEEHEWFAEKFAELIVGECAGVVADAVDHREPASTYVDKIKQHFGVEE